MYDLEHDGYEVLLHLFGIIQKAGMQLSCDAMEIRIE